MPKATKKQSSRSPFAQLVQQAHNNTLDMSTIDASVLEDIRCELYEHGFDMRLEQSAYEPDEFAADLAAVTAAIGRVEKHLLAKYAC